MPEALAVLVPLLNPNEPELQLVALHVADGAQVAAGDLLCTLESTKSAAEVTAEQPGFVAGLRARPGDRLRAGETLCWIAEDADWRPPEPARGPASERTEGLPAGLRITQPALSAAQEAGLDLNVLPVGPLITESVLQTYLAPPETLVAIGAEPAETAGELIVYGGGGHGKTLIDLIRALGAYAIAGVIDDGLKPGERVLDVPVLGGEADLGRIFEEGVHLAVNAVGGIGDVGSRIRVFHRLQAAGFRFPTLVHPRATVEPSAQIGPGAQVFTGAYVGSAARLGFGVIVNTHAVVSHDGELGDFVNISPGALLAGGVKVGAGALIGMGVSVNLGVTIGERARVGNSAVVVGDVPAGGMVRAGARWPERSG